MSDDMYCMICDSRGPRHAHPNQFETKDSGKRAEFASGMVRDTDEGKARFDLLMPEGVAYEDQLLTRFANLMERGARKYEARNWEKANSLEELDRAKSSAFRHFMQWFTGEKDEDHAAATLFNIMVAETVALKMSPRWQYKNKTLYELVAAGEGEVAKADRRGASTDRAGRFIGDPLDSDPFGNEPYRGTDSD